MNETSELYLDRLKNTESGEVDDLLKVLRLQVLEKFCPGKQGMTKLDCVDIELFNQDLIPRSGFPEVTEPGVVQAGVLQCRVWGLSSCMRRNLGMRWGIMTEQRCV